jgi:hypothetical protein
LKNKNKILNDIYIINFIFLLIFFEVIKKMGIGDWGLGIGDWGLGIGDW